MSTFSYYTFIDKHEMNCYYEFDENYFCQRVIYFQKQESPYSWADVYGNPYRLIPDVCFKSKIDKMKPIDLKVFEQLWMQDEEDFIGMHTVYKIANIDRD